MRVAVLAPVIASPHWMLPLLTMAIELAFAAVLVSACIWRPSLGKYLYPDDLSELPGDDLGEDAFEPSSD